MVYAQVSGGTTLQYRIQFFLVLLASAAIPGFSQDTVRANVRGDNRSDDGSGYDERRGYGNGRNQNGAYTVTCSSENGRRQYCEADVRGSVRLLRQFSRAACRQNETWGYDNRGIWVDRGCGADFEVGR